MRPRWKRIPAAASRAKSIPASQLGSIPRQIEGTQFGSIQAWIGPPEFLVGVDARYEALSAPGLFSSQDQDIRVITDPAVRDMMLGFGANKGLTGIGLFPLSPSAIVTVKPVHHLADFKGMKIRVLASPFQLEMIKRMDASPVAMSLGDVLPALQQGAIDGALGTVPVFGPLHYIDAAKYVSEIGQPYVNTIAVMNKKWLEALPPDLQKIVRDDAAATDKAIIPFVNDFYAAQRKAWTDNGGELSSLPADEQAAFLQKISDIGDTLSKDKPDLNKAVQVVIELGRAQQIARRRRCEVRPRHHRQACPTIRHPGVAAKRPSKSDGPGRASFEARFARTSG